MTMETFYLVCFGIGLVLSLATALGGFGHLHLGHFGGILGASMLAILRRGIMALMVFRP